VRTNIYRATMTASQKPAPTPPWFLTTSPERVARRAIRAIRRREGVVVITPFANAMWRFKRFAPGLFDRLQQFRRFKRKTGPIQFIPAPATSGEVPLPVRTAPATLHASPFTASDRSDLHAA
jgi:hypothetical protein